MTFDFNSVKTPCYVIDIGGLKKNLGILKQLKQDSGCKILLAQKAYSLYQTYPLISEYLDGCTASGINEALLGKRYFKGENHIFAPAYKDSEFDKIVKICDHIVFNSAAQVKKFAAGLKSKGKSVGLRVNPEFSTQNGGIYDPCAPLSRLGERAENISNEVIEAVDGLHFHTLCEQREDDLIRTIDVFEDKFGSFINGLKWVNFGGGVHITAENFGLKKLTEKIKSFRQKYKTDVYLEPGEAVVYKCGYLVSTVLDKVNNGGDILIVDTSAACHMPDVIEMPYRPQVIGGGGSREFLYDYRLSSLTCLAGDIIGDYSFQKPVNIGDKMVFEDMALYTFVKNNTFNGINLPSIYTSENGKVKLVKSFSYKDFKSRL